MGVKLFVGNLSPRTSEQQLARFFASAGVVASVRIPLSRDTGRSRGFAFVEFATEEAAENARLVFDGRELSGRQLRVSRARPEPERGAPGRAAERPRPERAPDVEPEPEPEEPWLAEDDPYGVERAARRNRGRGHGSDRRRRHGTRRFLV